METEQKEYGMLMPNKSVPEDMNWAVSLHPPSQGNTQHPWMIAIYVKEGKGVIRFNHEEYPHCLAEDFAKVFIDIVESIEFNPRLMGERVHEPYEPKRNEH